MKSGGGRLDYQRPLAAVNETKHPIIYPNTPRPMYKSSWKVPSDHIMLLSPLKYWYCSSPTTTVQPSLSHKLWDCSFNLAISGKCIWYCSRPILQPSLSHYLWDWPLNCIFGKCIWYCSSPTVLLHPFLSHLRWDWPFNCISGKCIWYCSSPILSTGSLSHLLWDWPFSCISGKCIWYCSSPILSTAMLIPPAVRLAL